MAGYFRTTERNHGSRDGFILAVQQGAARVAQDAAGGGRTTALGVWLDEGGHGVLVRLLREQELESGAGWVWRPHRIFPADQVTTEAREWLAEKLGLTKKD